MSGDDELINEMIDDQDFGICDQAERVEGLECRSFSEAVFDSSVRSSYNK